jgi:hypothetical protein
MVQTVGCHSASWTLPPLSNQHGDPSPTHCDPTNLQLEQNFCDPANLQLGQNFDIKSTLPLSKTQIENIKNILISNVEALNETLHKLIGDDPTNKEFFESICAALDRNPCPSSLTDISAKTLYQNLTKYLTPCSTKEERAHATAQFLNESLQALARKDDEWKYRWATNIFHVTLQTGLVVCLATVARELLGFAIAKITENQSLAIKEIIGMAALVFGISLNLAGLGRDLYNNTSTWKAIASRVGIIFISTITLYLSFVITSKDETKNVLSETSGAASQIIFYTVLRDLIQSFFWLSDNTPASLSGKVVLVGATEYSVLQFFQSEATRHWFKESGASAKQLNLLHTLGVAISNAVIETIDDLVRRSAGQHIARGAEDPVDALRIRLKAKIPSRSEFLDKIFKTCAFRTAVFEIITHTATIASALFAHTHLTDEAQHFAINAVMSSTLFVVYGQFMYGHDRRQPGSESVLPTLIRYRVTQPSQSSGVEDGDGTETTQVEGDITVIVGENTGTSG